MFSLGEGLASDTISALTWHRQVNDPACCTRVPGRRGPWRLDLDRVLAAFRRSSDFRSSEFQNSRPPPPGNEVVCASSLCFWGLKSPA